MKELVILGTGVFAEEVADLVRDGETHKLVGFAENRDRTRTKGPLLGLPVVWYEALPELPAETELLCAIGTTRRGEFTSWCAERGLSFARYVHSSARLSRTSELGAGSLLSVATVVAAHSRIGEHVIVNRGSLIGHHTKIGDRVTISPGANIGGRVRIGSQAYIGMGAIVLNDIKIGKGAIVGAGSVVTRDVPAHCQVLGIPARVTKENVEPH